MSNIHSAEPIYVLSISANDQDHASIVNVFGHSRWVIVPVTNLGAAYAELGRHDISVAVCDCDSTPEHWTEILRSLQAMPQAPAVVLTSRIADERLWSQGLACGAWDVLPKPFGAAEVVRSVRYAWEHWRNQHRVRPVARAMRAVG
jgi:DNA-binding response OmpR family regulator